MVATERHEARKTTKRELKDRMSVRSRKSPKNVRLREIPELKAPELSVVDFLSSIAESPSRDTCDNLMPNHSVFLSSRVRHEDVFIKETT
jgi:hypothetical protein